MQEPTTLAAVAAEVAAIRDRLDEQEQADIEAEQRIRQLLMGMEEDRQRAGQPLRVIPGSAKRRTKPWGKLTLVNAR